MTHVEHLSDYVPIDWDPLDGEPTSWRCRVCGDVTDDPDLL